MDLNDILKNFSNSSNSNLSGLQNILPLLMKGEFSNENLMNMLHAVDSVTDGMVTYAVRNTKIDKLTLKKGDIIGLNSKKILTKSNTVSGATISLIEKLKDKNHSLINLYYGADVTESDAEALSQQVAETYPDCDVELYFGGQSVYYYIISLE